MRSKSAALKSGTYLDVLRSMAESKDVWMRRALVGVYRMAGVTPPNELHDEDVWMVTESGRLWQEHLPRGDSGEHDTSR